MNIFRSILILIIAGAFAPAFSQFEPYELIQGNQSYQELDGDEQVSPVSAYPLYSVQRNLGFKVKLFGHTFSDVIFQPQELRFLTNDTTIIIDLLSSRVSETCDPQWDPDSPQTGNLPAVSRLSYKTEGELGGRILKVQWKNFSFEKSQPGDTINFQLWLFEGKDQIEWHYGVMKVETPEIINGEFELGVFIRPGSPVNRYSQYLYGEAEDPSIYSCGATGICDKWLTSVPKKDQVYIFTKSNGVIENKPLQKIMYSNLDSDNILLQIPGSSSEVIVYDSMGNTILRSAVQSNQMNFILNTSRFAPGLYSILLNGDNFYYSKIVKP